jgi:hypothetical protein
MTPICRRGLTSPRPGYRMELFLKAERIFIDTGILRIYIK